MKNAPRFSHRNGVLFAVFFCLAACARPQTPADGRTEQSVFRSSYFHLAYRYPSGLHPVDLRTMNLPQSGLNNEVLPPNSVCLGGCRCTSAGIASGSPGGWFSPKGLTPSSRSIKIEFPFPAPGFLPVL